MASGSAAAAAAVKECESCCSAPGIPFCRVEWSFLCGGCAAVVHANNWIVAVPPNPNPSAAPHAFPHLPFPFPNPNPSPDPNLVVHLSSSDEDRAGGGRGRRGRRGKAAAPPLRVESVMRYREKRKSRRFEKTVRYETRKAYAEQRPRVDGKFARPAESGTEGATPLAGDEVAPSPFQAMANEVGIPDAHFQGMTSADEAARQDVSEELIPAGGGQEEFVLTDAGRNCGCTDRI